jgi:hypothetical protein
MTDPNTQSDKFKEAARHAECDKDEWRWEEPLRGVAGEKQPPENGGA